eukprot:PhF_6_TR33690/c0_g1_i7/m.49394
MLSVLPSSTLCSLSGDAFFRILEFLSTPLVITPEKNVYGNPGDILFRLGLSCDTIVTSIPGDIALTCRAFNQVVQDFRTCAPTLREVNRSIIEIEVTSDVQGGGTGYEYARNLLVDGAFHWNKWYTTSTTPQTITYTLKRPDPIHAYAIRLG